MPFFCCLIFSLRPLKWYIFTNLMSICSRLKYYSQKVLVVLKFPGIKKSGSHVCCFLHCLKLVLNWYTQIYKCCWQSLFNAIHLSLVLFVMFYVVWSCIRATALWKVYFYNIISSPFISIYCSVLWSNFALNFNWKIHYIFF